MVLASLILSFADANDVDAVRRLLHNFQGLLQEEFVLVEIPNALHAGFHHSLSQLQNQSKGDKELAFLSAIAPSNPRASPQVSPPRYTADGELVFQLDSICKEDAVTGNDPLTLKPSGVLSSSSSQENFIDKLCLRTTLDRGQATALCETLCRGFAFTQGPPGTGKT